MSPIELLWTAKNKQEQTSSNRVLTLNLFKSATTIEHTEPFSFVFACASFKQQESMEQHSFDFFKLLKYTLDYFCQIFMNMCIHFNGINKTIF